MTKSKLTEKKIQEIKADAGTAALYSITDNPNTPKDVKKFLLEKIFEKNGLSVSFSEIESNQKKQIGLDTEIRLTPERASELSEWIITQTTGIFSAGAEDDKQKQAFLILLSAIVYEEEMTQRESILFDVSNSVFRYSYACSNAENQFIKDGFEDWKSGKWNLNIKNEVKN